MKYLNRTQKTLKLPSGAEIEIYKLNSLCEPFCSPEKDELKRGVILSRFILANRTGKLRFEGEEAMLVDAPRDKAGDGCISIDSIEQADSDVIVNGVLEFSGLTKAGQEARKTFPEGQEAGGVPAPSRQGIRVLADDTAQAVNG